MTALPEIESRFDVLAKLGEGGMGCVYKVRHRDLDEVQIVKTLQAHLSSSADLRERFINEARRGMRLRHPHIAGVHDFQVCADGTGFIVMEFVSGQNLRDLLAAKGPLPLPLVGTIAVQTLDALAYLHSEKFVHRDISPDNLMLTTTADGRPFVKLIDLGISKSLDSGQTMTATGQFVGKVSYASPEQFGGELDGRSDLYSFGVVLYKLLTNADPFTGANVNQIIAAHLFQPPRPFDETAPGNQIPGAVQDVIYRALEKKPDARYADATEFAAAVEEAFGIQDSRPTRSLLTRPAVTRPGPTQPERTRPATTALPASDRTEVVPSSDATVVVPSGDQTRVVTANEGRASARLAAEPTVQDLATEVALDRPAAAGPALSRRTWIAVAAAIALIAIAAIGWQRIQAAKLASYGKFYAVVIGQSDYRRYERLPTALDDARAVANLLQTKYGYEVTRLENAETPQILAAIQTTARKMTDQDNLLIFYAGHGELRNEKGYWLPVDADFEMTNWVSPATIRDILIDHPARRTLVLADSCYSGAMARGTLSSVDAGQRKDKRSRLSISSGGTAPVIDSADGTHSIFTRALLETLGEPSSSVVDVQRLFPRIREKVTDTARRAGRDQNPELAVIAEVGDEGGSYYFIAR